MGSDWEATPWLLGALLFPLAGAAAVLALVESEGGDFAAWSTAQAAAALVALFVAPAAASAWFARRHGWGEAIAWALACLGVQVALVVGVGFVALGFGPS